MTRAMRLVAVLLLAAVWTPAADAYDPEQTFKQRTFVVSPEVSYGDQFDLEGKQDFTDLSFVNAGVRFGWLPFAPLARDSPLYGAFEVGLEPLYQQYLEPELVYFAGLGLTFRYHFLSLGRVVPWVDVAAFAGGTNLKIREIRSDFTFLLWGGAGVSYFITDRTSIYAGYRLQHVSNGNTSRPNRGFESHTGVLGVSFFFE